MPLTQVSSRAIEDTLRYVLGASGTDHYTFTGKGLTGAVNDPALTLSRGHTYIFENRSGGHPFYIKTSIANGGTNDAYNTGVTNNGGGNGTEIVFTVPHDAPDTLYYQCSSHSSMAGQLSISGSVADGSITEAKLADDAVTNAKIGASAVGSTEIATNAIVSDKINTGQVTTAKLGDLAVSTAKLGDDAVTTAKIAAGNITATELATDSVTGAKIAAGAINNANKIQDSIITGAKIGSGTIAAGNIASNAVTDAKINGMAASKLTGALPAIDGSSLTGITSKVIQCVTSYYSSQHSTSSSNLTDTGHTLVITPTSNSNKIIIMNQTSGGNNQSGRSWKHMLTYSIGGSVANGRYMQLGDDGDNSSFAFSHVLFWFHSSPGTNEITYQTRHATDGSGTAYYGYSGSYMVAWEVTP